MGLARGWMMPGLAGRDCEAAGRGQPVGEKELGFQAEMLRGKVKWFFQGSVIIKSGENREARCGFQVLSWLMRAGGGGLQFLGGQRSKTTQHTLGHSRVLGFCAPAPAELPGWGARGWSPHKHGIPMLFELKIQPCFRLEVRQTHGMVWLGRDL